VVEVVAALPGPAGVSAVELPDGTAWEVDHAEPGRLVRLELVGPLHADAVARLAVGEEGVLFLSEEVPGEVDDDGPSFPDTWRSNPFGPHHDAVAAGQLILLADLARDADLPTLARVAAAVQLAGADGDPALLDVLRPVIADTWDLAGRLSEDVDDDTLADIGPKTAMWFAQALGRAVGAGLSPIGWTDDLRRRLRRISRGFPRDAAFDVLSDLAVSSPHLASAPWNGRDDALADVGPAEDWQAVQRVAEALVRVEVARSDRVRWVRVFRVDGLVLLGQAPLRHDGLLDVAEVVVPPTTPDSELRVVVVDAEQVEPGSRPLRQMRSAVRAGRRAARARRLHQHGESMRWWEECAHHWDAAGDPVRADLARELSAGSPRSGPRGGAAPLLADRLAETDTMGASVDDRDRW
jgi:hypothetical protein